MYRARSAFVRPAFGSTTRSGCVIATEPIIGDSTSRFTALAFLSTRSPSKAGWRSAPSRVHSVNRTWQTSSGFTHVAPLMCGASTTGGSFTVIFDIFATRSSSDARVKPVPTLPA